MKKRRKRKISLELDRKETGTCMGVCVRLCHTARVLSASKGIVKKYSNRRNNQLTLTIVCVFMQ